MTRKKYIISTALIIFLMILVAIVVSNVTTTANTLISNELAMNQLQNDDYPYIQMELYNNLIMPVVKVLGVSFWIAGGLLISVNTYKLFRYYHRKEN